MKQWLVLVGSLCFYFTVFSQDNAAARYEINAKRIGVNPTDKDALPRSREFLRLDSTYYVGWMYEGMYKYDRSADFLGYKNAIVPLKKALVLLNKDFGSTLRNINSSVAFFSENIKLFQDYFVIVNALKESYDNIEMPDSVMALLDDVDRYHFQRDFFGLYEQRAWEYHRNRFFTEDKFSFLKNSVADNEQQAFQICYQGFAFIQKNKALNDAWFGASQSEQDKLRIDHYLALLHCYNKHYDSSEYYYQQLAQGGMISWNNYGGMQSEIGNFATAKEYFARDEFGSGHGFLNEPFYYLPTLHIYSDKPKQAISMCQEIIAQNGSTPGFGWYNIALARGFLYDGQLDSAAFALNKAANFKELHIGTTLTQTQYDFTINLLKVQLQDKSIAQIKFLNRHWWFSPSALYKIASLKLQKLMQEYVVVNQLAYDPDRTRLVYDLFCAESTTTFDEAWYLLKNFSPKYFEKKYQTYLQTDKRENMQRYFKLFESQFKWENGDKEEAQKDWEWMIKTTTLDTANEKLFLERLYQNMSTAYKKENTIDYNKYCNLMMQSYPQLVPYSGLTIPVQLTVLGDETTVTNDVVDDLKNCNLNFSNRNADVASASISFVQKGDKYQATLNMKSGNGKVLVANQKLVFKNADGVGEELALRLFGKGGNIVFEPSQQQ